MLLTGATYAPFGAPTGWSYGNARYLGRILDLDYRAASILDSAAGGLDAGFAYDAVGNLQKLHDGALASPPRATLDYDNLNRLTAFRDGPTGTPIDAYTYDATGNRTSFANAAGTQAYLYAPGSHRLASIDAAPRGYDAAGNTTSIGGTAKTFTYDATNRLSEVKASSVTLRQYAYNGNGELVRSYLGSSSTYSVYDEAGRWLGDYDGSGSPIQQAVWMDDLPVGLLVGASPAAGRLHYIQPDHLGTPRVVIEPARDVAVWTWDLKGEAFGDSTPNEDPDGDSVAFTLDMRFPGQRHDAASGLSYNYFRDYESGVGRYIQSDPIGLLGGTNTYAYVEGSPINRMDPLGLFDVRGRRLLGGENKGKIVYEVQFYNRFLGLARDGKMFAARALPGSARTLDKAITWGYGKPAGVSTMPRSKRMACDAFDGEAKEIFREKFGDRTISEEELRWFISKINEMRPDLRYDADVIISDVANGLPPFQ